MQIILKGILSALKMSNNYGNNSASGFNLNGLAPVDFLPAFLYDVRNLIYYNRLDS